jgi:hypothetical protein
MNAAGSHRRLRHNGAQGCCFAPEALRHEAMCRTAKGLVHYFESLYLFDWLGDVAWP